MNNDEFSRLNNTYSKMENNVICLSPLFCAQYKIIIRGIIYRRDILQFTLFSKFYVFKIGTAKIN